MFIGVKVLCSIALAFKVGGIPIIANDSVKGTVTNYNDTMVLVDFSRSKQAKDADIITDLKQPILVEVNKCMTVGN